MGIDSLSGQSLDPGFEVNLIRSIGSIFDPMTAIREFPYLLPVSPSFPIFES